MMAMMMILGALGLSGLSVLALASKLVGWSYGPFGLLVMLANVPYETVVKKIRMSRFSADVVALVGLTAGWWGLAGPVAGLVFALVFCVAWAHALHADGMAVRSNPGVQERRYLGHIPMPHPRVVVMINGPVWAWGRRCDLGDWPVGRKATFELLVLNPTTIVPQVPMRVTTSSAQPGVLITGLPAGDVATPGPGDFVRISFAIAALDPAQHAVDLSVSVGIGDFLIHKRLRIRSVFDPKLHQLQHADINRWQGGALAGFAWRGDMDMVDPATFQSVAGLRWTLDLSARFRIASTLFLSGRLSLDPNEHRTFCEHLGVDRQTGEIDRFIQFMRDEVTLGDKIDFPCETPRRYALEVGNHMYLHYGTHAAMAAENGWTNRARMLAGRYPWQSPELGSFAEQRDNARVNAARIKACLGVDIKTWGVPGRDYDEETPRAVEAAGMEVGSDTNASAFTNVLRLPPPHHPQGCERLVELTKKYPGDPDNVFKIAMLKYWLWLARRRRSVFVFMAHHHLLRYEGMACTGMTETLLRFVLEQGGSYITTLYGLGTYWEKVLCPRHRCVQVRMDAAGDLEIENRGEVPLDSIPVELRFAGGRRMVVLANLPARKAIRVSVLN